MELVALFDNVKVLLQDICTFLNKEVTIATLESESAKIAKDLLRRSMIQILDIDHVNKSNNGPDAPDQYLDMRIKRGDKQPEQIDEYVDSDAKPIHDDEKQDIYSDANEEAEVNECPHKNSMLTEIETIKDGFLSRKENFVYIFERPRKYYVVLCEDWIMFYNANKRGKPLETYYLKHCKAAKRDDVSSMFELHMSDKSFIMVANTRKEKLQWINVINDDTIREKAVENPKSFQSIEDTKHHDLNESGPSPVAVEEEENVYEEVPECLKKVTPLYPPLQSQQIPTLPPPRHNQVNEYSNYNNDDIYDFVQAPSDTEIYDYLKPVDDEIYDYLKDRPVSDPVPVVPVKTNQSKVAEKKSNSSAIQPNDKVLNEEDPKGMKSKETTPKKKTRSSISFSRSKKQ